MVVYRECLSYSGRGKLNCLINAIIRDYEKGVLSKDTAALRLRYLIALNRANNWVSDTEAKALVANALERINALPKRGELRKIAERVIA